MHEMWSMILASDCQPLFLCHAYGCAKTAERIDVVFGWRSLWIKKRTRWGRISTARERGFDAAFTRLLCPLVNNYLRQTITYDIFEGVKLGESRETRFFRLPVCMLGLARYLNKSSGRYRPIAQVFGWDWRAVDSIYSGWPRFAISHAFAGSAIVHYWHLLGGVPHDPSQLHRSTERYEWRFCFEWWQYDKVVQIQMPYIG